MYVSRGALDVLYLTFVSLFDSSSMTTLASLLLDC